MSRAPARRTKPGTPRYTWSVDALAPRPMTERTPAPDLAWTGQITRNPGDHVGGDLRGCGWALAISGTVSDDGAVMHTRLWVIGRGTLLMPSEDHGITGDLWDGAVNGSWTLDLTRGEAGGWTGRVAGRSGWVLQVSGAAVRPGCMTLRGVVRAGVTP